MKPVVKRTPHPMLLAASVALILFCMVGTAAIMGWIPSSMGRESDIAALEKTKPAAVAEKKASVAPVAKKRTAPVTVADAPSKTSIACANCGVIESVRSVEAGGSGSGVGAIGGAVVGGLLGNQVGGGSGKDAMTVVGAIGGALAGNHIEKRVNATTSYEIVVRMENGSSQIITEGHQAGWRSGDRVKIFNGVMRSA